MIERWMRHYIRHEDIGWKEVGERFTRYFLLESSWLQIYIHQIYSPFWHPECHDHPWSFVTFILKTGYWERVGEDAWFRKAGSILYRPAEFMHNVKTSGVAWTLVFAGPERRKWQHKVC